MACASLPYSGILVCVWMHRHKKRAENGTRTRDPDLGKVVLYQLSYFRLFI